MGIKGKNDRMVVLACEECKRRNYTTVKNKKNIKERMELNKYCPFCQKHPAIYQPHITNHIKRKLILSTCKDKENPHKKG